MSSNHVLNAQPRDVSGTGASRRQRRDSHVPAVVYGAGKDSETVTLDHDQVIHSLEKEAFHSAIIDLKTDGGIAAGYSPRSADASAPPTGVAHGFPAYQGN